MFLIRVADLGEHRLRFGAPGIGIIAFVPYWRGAISIGG
jgi:hypothetical protein